MSLSGLYIKFTDLRRRQDYPAIVSYNGSFYETNTNALTAKANNIQGVKYTTMVSEVTAFNTLNACVVTLANEDSRPFATPAAVYAYYDV